MVKHRNPCWLALAITACAAPPHVATPAPPQHSDTHALVGTPAPHFTLPVIRGSDSADLVGLAGHVVVVDFWASWCQPCTTAVPLLNAWRDKYDARGLRVIGVSGDEASEIARYATENQVGFTVARDDDDKVAAAYQVVGLPTLVVIDKTGIVRYIDVGARDLAAVEARVAALLE